MTKGELDRIRHRLNQARFSDWEESDPAIYEVLGTHVPALIAALESALSQLDEKWPNLKHQMRDRLTALCEACGIDTVNNWLSDSACQAIEKLQSENAALQQRIGELEAENGELKRNSARIQATLKAKR